MVTRNARQARSGRLFLICFLLAFALLPTIASCGTNTQAASSTPKTPASTPTTSAQPSSSPTVQSSAVPEGPIPTNVPSVLHGPTNFILKTPFNFSEVSGSDIDVNGTPTALPDSTVESGITREFQHLLFVVDSSNNVEVYVPGSTSPTKAQVTQRTDGSVEIEYTQTLESDLGVAKTSFDGVVFNGQIYTQYQQDYSPSINTAGDESDVTVAFSTNVQWIPASQIPTAPENARFQFTPNGAIALAWDAGKHAAAYDVYRMIPGEDQQFQLIATVKTTTYTDSSQDAWQNAHSSAGITYGVFSVGTSGVENPSGLPIPVATS